MCRVLLIYIHGFKIKKKIWLKHSYLGSHTMVETIHNVIQQVNIQFLVEVQQLSRCMVG